MFDVLNSISVHVLQLPTDKNGRIAIASPFLCKENRIWIIHTSLSIENNALTLEQATAVLSGIHILGQLFEIQ